MVGLTRGFASPQANLCQLLAIAHAWSEVVHTMGSLRCNKNLSAGLISRGLTHLAIHL